MVITCIPCSKVTWKKLEGGPEKTVLLSYLAKPTGFFTPCFALEAGKIILSISSFSSATE